MSRHRCRFRVVLILFVAAATGFAQEQNSTKKIRVQPSKIAAKIGSAVHWETSFADAMAKSKESGKPVFWYVPTLRGSFMDRKVEIDRYMMAGPFSWPHLIDGINQTFVPVRAVPSREEQKQFQLLPYKFVEPGFLVIDPTGQVTNKVDRITTFSPQWIQSLLVDCGAEIRQPELPADLAGWWSEFRQGNYDIEIPVPNAGDTHATEQLLLAGMYKFNQGDHTAARKLWQESALMQPDSPLAWKAAAEAEGFGPFYRGFEIHRDLSPSALTAGIQSIGSAAPTGTYDEADLWKLSVEFLLRMQREDGGWVDCDYDFGGTDSLPNVHVAITALCGMAMMNAKSQVPEHADAIDSAIKRAAKFVTDEQNINRVDRDEILWAHAYRVRFLARLLAAGEQVKTKLQSAVNDLENVQSKRGHWYHEYNNSWVTATALCALHEAAASGATVNQEIIDKGCTALANDRFQNGSYGYYPRRAVGGNPEGDEESIAAAAGRMPPCDLGLWYWNKLTDDELINAITQSFKHHDSLAVALKYDNHTSTYAYGGFFFWYDMRARSEAISQVAHEQLRRKFFEMQKELVMNLPEFDGCFVDSHELGRCYGTAMALLCLARDNQVTNQP